MRAFGSTANARWHSWPALDSLAHRTDVLDLMKTTALEDTAAPVRAATLDYLAGLTPVSDADTASYVAVFEQAVQTDSSYAATAAALNGLYLLDHQKGLAAAKAMTDIVNDDLSYQVGEILMLENDPKAPHYLHKQLLKLPVGFMKLLLMDRASDYALHT